MSASRRGDVIAIAPFGERALTIECEPGSRRAPELARALEEANIVGVEEIVGAFDSVVVHLEEGASAGAALITIDGVLRARVGASHAANAPNEHVFEVVYDGADLAEVARATGMSIDEVVELHARGRYVVEALGFMPGFAYLGGLDPRLCLPRRATPRPAVAAGSVAIAAERTAIYPGSSPGGWHLIGSARLPSPLFSPTASPPCPLSVGDIVRFTAVRP